MTATFTVSGLNLFTKQSKELGERINRPFMLTDSQRKITEDFTRQAFEQIRAGQSGGYAPLSPAYKAWKDANKPGRPILVFSGRLVKSFLDPRSRFMSVKTTRRGSALEISSTVKYARYHQEGTRKMPARPLFIANRETASRFRKILWEQVSTGHYGKQWQRIFVGGASSQGSRAG